MKIKNLSEILDSKEKELELELKFIHYVSSVNGILSEPYFQPKDYKNVIRLSGNLYLAFDDADINAVYVGGLI